MKEGVDYIGVGVGAIIVKSGKILIQKRSQKVRNDRGKWEIPGGGIELGETQEEALKREVMEEVGIEVEPVELLSVYDNIIPADKQHWIAPTYLCKILKGDPQIMEPEKSDDLKWFSLEEAKKLDLAAITRNDIRFLELRFPKGLPENL